MLLTSALKTPETTMAFQQYVLEAASGASPYRYSALRLTFGNTINAIKQERQKIEEEQKAREEAARQEELMSRPVLECRMTLEARGWERYQRIGCGEMSIQDVTDACTCGRSLVCSKCHWAWGRGNVCENCDRKFR